MYKHIGYVWPGMERIDIETAKSLIEKGIVYRLNDDNSESAVTDLSEFDPDGEYGIEFGDDFAFEEYFKSNVDDTGFVCFCHGTGDPYDLLSLALDLFDVSKICVSSGIRTSMEDLTVRVRTALDSDDEEQKWVIWRAVSDFINDMIPDGWIFGNYRNEGIDYGFVKK